MSRSISAKIVRNLICSWYFAAQELGLDCNLLLTVRPSDIDQLNLVERIKRWQAVLNKVAQFSRDHKYPCVYIWSRESDPAAGTGEHLHVLLHVPPALIPRFKAVAAGWFPEDGETDIRPADYRVSRTPSRKFRTAVGYLLKNSPQAAYGGHVEYRKGGPILGKRAGCSRNIDAPRRAAWGASRRVQRSTAAHVRMLPQAKSHEPRHTPILPP